MSSVAKHCFYFLKFALIREIRVKAPSHSRFRHFSAKNRMVIPTVGNVFGDFHVKLPIVNDVFIPNERGCGLLPALRASLGARCGSANLFALTLSMTVFAMCHLPSAISRQDNPCKGLKSEISILKFQISDLHEHEFVHSLFH